MSAGLSRADLRNAVLACRNYRAYLGRRRKGIDPDLAASLDRCARELTALADRMRERELEQRQALDGEGDARNEGERSARSASPRSRADSGPTDPAATL